MSYPDVTTVTEPFSATVLAIDLDATPQVDQFLEVAATTGWCEVDADGIANNVPLGQSGPFVVLVGSEQILCAKAQGSQLFVYLDEDVTGRGFGETSVVAHPNGTAVSLYATSVQSVATGAIANWGQASTARYSGSGSPSGAVTPSAAGDLYIDETTSTPAIWQATGTMDTDWQQVGGGGGAVSLSGAGLTTSPGLLLQSGGFHVYDGENDGAFATTIASSPAAGAGIQSLGDGAGVSLSSQSWTTSRGETEINAGRTGDIRIGLGGGLSIDSTGYALNPDPGSLTVVAGVNDTFIYTPIATGTPETFTMAPGTSTGTSAIADAVAAATGSDSGEAFSTKVQMASQSFDDAGAIYFLTASSLTATEDGDTLTTGPTDVLAELGFVSPVTFVGFAGDFLKFWDGTAVAQQTVVGSLSTVVDPAVKAVLTSLIAALAPATGYGLVIDGTT